MAQLFETALPEGRMLDVGLTQGELLVTLSGNWIEDVRFSASGGAHMLGVSAPARSSEYSYVFIRRKQEEKRMASSQDYLQFVLEVIVSRKISNPKPKSCPADTA